MAKGLEWTLEQQEVAELLWGGADSQAIIAKGYSKTMVSRVVNAIKTELKQPETFLKNTNKTEIIGKKRVIEIETDAEIEAATRKQIPKTESG